MYVGRLASIPNRNITQFCIDVKTNIIECIYNATTLETLFASDSPKGKVSQSLDYKAISSDPGSCGGKLYMFDGKLLQVMEDAQNDGTAFVTLRVATKSSYDGVILCRKYSQRR